MPMRPVTPFMMMPRVFAILSLHLQGRPGRPQADPGSKAPALEAGVVGPGSPLRSGRDDGAC